MELTLPLAELEHPAVLLASGPGPAPAPEDRTDPPPYCAILSQLDRETGLRGWMLQVQHGRVALWPKHHFSRAAAGRPPMLSVRDEALTALGYEAADSGARWRWSESTTLDGKQVQLYAVLYVRPLSAHTEAIGRKGTGKTSAADLSAHARRIAAAGS